MNASSFSPRATALTLALAAAWPVASAQVVAQRISLPDTVITATRFAEPVQALPLGVSVVTADESAPPLSDTTRPRLWLLRR